MHCVIWSNVRDRAGEHERTEFEETFARSFGISRDVVVFHWLGPEPSHDARAALLAQIAESDRQYTVHIDKAKDDVLHALTETGVIDRWPRHHVALRFSTTHQCNKSLCITLTHLTSIRSHVHEASRDAAE